MLIFFVYWQFKLLLLITCLYFVLLSFSCRIFFTINLVFVHLSYFYRERGDLIKQNANIRV